MFANNGSEDDVLNRAGYLTRYQYVNGSVEPHLFSPPAELRNAIPTDLFEQRRSTLKSLSYLTLDLVIILTLFVYAYVVLDRRQSPYCFQVVGYLVYWFLKGSFLFGIWLIGH